MKSRPLLLAVLVAALLLPPWSAAAGEEIVIEAAGLSPQVLRAGMDHRVRFVNRTGKPVHVEFIGDSGWHHVEQLQDEIWAVFHRPGLHPYVVPLTNDRLGELHGTVEVRSDPRGRPEPQDCVGVTVMGACLER